MRVRKVANLVAGRRFRPRRATLVTSAIVGCAANAASALTVGFPFLLTAVARQYQLVRTCDGSIDQCSHAFINQTADNSPGRFQQAAEKPSPGALHAVTFCDVNDFVRHYACQLILGLQQR